MTQYATNTRSRNNGKEVSAMAISLAKDLTKEMDKESVYLMTAFLTFTTDIKSCRVDNDPVQSLARQIDYVADNRFDGKKEESVRICNLFLKFFDVKKFQKDSAQATPKGKFVAWLNQSKNAELAVALAKGKELGLSDLEALETLTLWTKKEAIPA